MGFDNFNENQKLKMISKILTIKQILTDNFDVNDFSLINSMNLKQIGYKLRGNYIIKVIYMLIQLVMNF